MRRFDALRFLRHGMPAVIVLAGLASMVIGGFSLVSAEGAAHLIAAGLRCCCSTCSSASRSPATRRPATRRSPRGRR